MFFEPQGLTGALGDSQITAPGTNIGDTASIYVSQVKRELTTEYVGDDEYLGLNVAKVSWRELMKTNTNNIIVASLLIPHSNTNRFACAAVRGQP